ncbi:MAG: hypothetical protein ACOCWC_04125, partial [Bacteroidota bacterium]
RFAWVFGSFGLAKRIRKNIYFHFCLNTKTLICNTLDNAVISKLYPNHDLQKPFYYNNSSYNYLYNLISSFSYK